MSKPTTLVTIGYTCPIWNELKEFSAVTETWGTLDLATRKLQLGLIEGIMNSNFGQARKRKMLDGVLALKPWVISYDRVAVAA